jgi:hypothetical protein
MKPYHQLKPLRIAVLGPALALLACRGSERGPELEAPYSNQSAVAAVVKAAPAGWSLAGTTPDQIPRGHHWSDGYKGHGGTKVVLVGPTPVNLHWCDTAGQWHDDPLASEALELWLLPPEYREGLSAMDVHAPIPAELVVSSNAIRVYAKPTHHLRSEEQFYALLKGATSTSWPESPHDTERPLSWAAWRTDIAKAVAGGV